MTCSTSSWSVQTPKFWRDPALPFIEARKIQDGRHICYARHAHETFSIGSITGGTCTYLNGLHSELISVGAVVVINPGDVHACNPVDRQSWSYHMMHVDPHWLACRQREAGWYLASGFRPFATRLTTEPLLFDGLSQLYSILVDGQAGAQQKIDRATSFFTDLACMFDPRIISGGRSKPGLERLADYIRENCTKSLTIEDMCVIGGLSSAHMTRLFKAQYGMTPHAYQINCRVEYSRAQLRHGRAIAEVAVEAGFSDQAHLQRVFRQMTAATPGQYRKYTA